MTRTNRLALLLVALPACVALHRQDLIPDDRDQVAVGYFGNDTFYRGLEFPLTEQVVAEIFSRPGLRLTSKEEAEVILSGRIVDVRQRVLSDDPSQVVTSQSSRITVAVEVRDARSGEVLSSHRLEEYGEFVPAIGEELGDAQQEALALLARDIVRLLEEDF